jgi:hypothetical protein
MVSEIDIINFCVLLNGSNSLESLYGFDSGDNNFLISRRKCTKGIKEI